MKTKLVNNNYAYSWDSLVKRIGFKDGGKMDLTKWGKHKYIT